MKQQQDDALLLRALPYSDSSLILHILTQHHGRISLMARGARRAKSPFRASLMPLHQLNITWREPRTGNMGTLIDVQRLRPLLSEQKVLAGQALLAKASILFPDGVHAGFEELWNALHTLSHRPEDSGLMAATWGMMLDAGWVGDFEHCWHCSEHIDLIETMFWRQAHLLCESCANKQGLLLSSGCRKSLHTHLSQTNIKLTKDYIQTWESMIQAAFQQHKTTKS